MTVSLMITDVGGSIVLHMFGAYFGLACSVFLSSNPAKDNKQNGSNYVSNLVAFVGTVFLYIYWPSFNAGL